MNCVKDNVHWDKVTTKLKKEVMTILDLKLTTNNYSLKDRELELFARLKNNRQTASQQIHRDAKGEFLSSIYSDKKLLNYSKTILHDKYITKGLLLTLLEYEIRKPLQIHDFGRRLIVYYHTDPEAIIKVMLQGINLLN